MNMIIGACCGHLMMHGYIVGDFRESAVGAVIIIAYILDAVITRNKFKKIISRLK